MGKSFEDRCVYGGRTGKNYLNLVISHLVDPRGGTAEKGWLCKATVAPRMEEEGDGVWEGL